jgi:predicted ribosomally synthesized peptide with nif11-like leader
MKNLTPEMIEKAKAAKSAEELLALAKESGVEMTADEAKTYFAQLNPKSGELNEDDLDLVSGGCNDSDDSGSNVKDVVTLYNEVSGLACPKCGKLNCWTLTTVNYYNNGINYWKCNYCAKEVMTLNSENNSILH